MARPSGGVVGMGAVVGMICGGLRLEVGFYSVREGQ